MTAEEMIEELREKALRDKEQAEAILAAKDEDFHIETCRGVHVRSNIKVLQEGLPKGDK